MNKRILVNLEKKYLGETLGPGNSSSSKTNLRAGARSSQEEGEV